ncbi:hypothetical protein ACE1ET_11010 [Saccharicrinis sp. FJH62]|uniref:hypothetical protein n=1 Tax=Saccharicrinis sp. FJH62 TaxID=3344657 RepID=UPI0035D49DC9
MKYRFFASFYYAQDDSQTGSLRAGGWVGLRMIRKPTHPPDRTLLYTCHSG